MTDLQTIKARLAIWRDLPPDKRDVEGLLREVCEMEKREAKKGKKNR